MFAARRPPGRPHAADVGAPRARAGFPPQPLVPGPAVSVALTSGDDRRRRDRHRRLRRRRRRLAVRPPARRAPAGARCSSRTPTSHGRQQPARRPRPRDLQARLAGQRHRHGHRTTPPPPSPAGSARCRRATRCKVFARDLDTGRTRSLTTLDRRRGRRRRPDRAVDPRRRRLGRRRRGRGERARRRARAPERRDVRRRHAARAQAPIALLPALRRRRRRPERARGRGSRWTSRRPPTLIDGYLFGVLHPTSVEVGLRLRRGLRQAYLLDASGPRRARRGGRSR